MPVASSAALAAVTIQTMPAARYEKMAAGPVSSSATPASRKIPAPIMVPAPMVSASQKPSSRRRSSCAMDENELWLEMNTAPPASRPLHLYNGGWFAARSRHLVALTPSIGAERLRASLPLAPSPVLTR